MKYSDNTQYGKYQQDFGEMQGPDEYEEAIK